MSAPQVRGIVGLLDGILSPGQQAVTNSPKASYPMSKRPVGEPSLLSTAPFPVPVKRGRPPGKRRAASPKEKVTLRIASSLIALYRDWTWEARCQLSTLIQLAMEDYRNRH
jgi:hypothetical protein